MARATFKERILDLTGTDISDDNALSEWLKDAIREIMHVMPKEELLKMSSEIAIGGPAGMNLSDYKEILAVTRTDSGSQKRACREIPSNQIGAVENSDSSSLFYAGGQQDPVFYIKNGQLYVKPQPTASEKAQVQVIPYPTISFDAVSVGSIASSKTVASTTGSAGTQYTFNSTAHGFAIGDTVELSGFDELTALNGVVSTISSPGSEDSFQLEGIISTGTQETTGGVANKITTSFPEGLEYLLVLYTSIRVFQRKLAEKETGNVSIPAGIVMPNAPSAPTMSEKSVDTLPSAPTYVSPVLSLTASPTISDLSISSVAPVAPTLTTNSVDLSSINSLRPSYVSPVMASISYDGDGSTDDWIVNEEDSEMLGARVQEIQAKVGEYQAKVQDSLNSFQKDTTIYQQEVQAAIKNGDLSSGDDSQLVQKFQAEIGVYQQNVQNEVQEFTTNMQKEMQIWQTQIQSDISQYQSDIQNASAKFQEGVTEYQAKVQKEMTDAQLEESKEGRDLQKYGAELQSYSAEIQKETARLSGELQKYTSEIQSMGVDYQWLQGQMQTLKEDYMRGIQILVGGNTPPQPQQGAR